MVTELWLRQFDRIRCRKVSQGRAFGLPKVQVLEASTLSRKAAEIWRPSREFQTGLCGATILKNREERRNQRSAFTQVSMPRSLDRCFFPGTVLLKSEQ